MADKQAGVVNWRAFIGNHGIRGQFGKSREQPPLYFARIGKTNLQARTGTLAVLASPIRATGKSAHPTSKVVESDAHATAQRVLRPIGILNAMPSTHSTSPVTGSVPSRRCRLPLIGEGTSVFGVLRWTFLCIALCVADQGSLLAQQAEFFRDQVAPLLKKHCLECHSHVADSIEGSLTLDSKVGWVTGGDSGPAIVPGNAGDSLLWQAVGYQNELLKMPPSGKLSDKDVAILRKWIEDGAYDPRDSGADPVTAKSGLGSTDDHWSLQPIRVPPVPNVSDVAWTRNSIDSFVLSRLETAEMFPASDADRATWLRRVSYDLTGLPPSVDEVLRFRNDESPQAFERVVDRLLASPSFGEKWGRRWLDLARYADSNGADINYAHANAWQYRDYVVRSFNADKPFDQFVVEQVAGDLLSTNASEELQNDRLMATGFLQLGPKMLAEVDTDKLLLDVVDEQLDVLGKTFLGMTFGCARCHDHKFDPISTRDYYSLAGIFLSTKSIGKLRTVDTKVSEWLEAELKSKQIDVRVSLQTKTLQGIERRLKELGATVRPPQTKSNAAPLAVRNLNLPKIESTTWAAWVRVNSVRPNMDAVISANYAGANQGHSLGFHAGGTALVPRVVWNHGTGNHRIVVAPQPITFGKWHHLSLSYDMPTRELRLYVDGQQQAAASGVEGTPFYVLAAGRREASEQFGFRGDLDDVVIYDRALSAAQIAKVMHGDVPLSGLVLHWDFDPTLNQAVSKDGGAKDGGAKDGVSKDNRPISTVPTIIADRSKNGRSGQLVGFSGGSEMFVEGHVGKALRFPSSNKTAALPAAVQREVIQLRGEWERVRGSMVERPQVMSVAAGRPVDMPVMVRGNHLKPSLSVVPRGMPHVFQRHFRPVPIGSEDNGRLHLAQWMVDHRHPLTSRVIVNRIWQGYFGQGLVRSPSNFGLRGSSPTHPLLLDWLAKELVSQNWSLKSLHRQIALSRTYRMGGGVNGDYLARDPSNRMLWHHATRRLDVEEIRDSLLLAGGGLDTAVGGSLLKSPNYKRVELQPESAVYDAPRRAIYLPVVRVRSYSMFNIFDLPTAGQHIAQRAPTIVPPQALFMMNNPLVLRQADQLAAHTCKLLTDDTERLQSLYRRLYGRDANDSELEFGLQKVEHLRRFLKVTRSDDRQVWTALCHVMLAANDFLYIR
jgi:hypothetical protein